LIFTGILAGISGISENQIFRCLPVFFPKREKNPCLQYKEYIVFITKSNEQQRGRITPTIHVFAR
jgi:hypothetical protein